MSSFVTGGTGFIGKRLVGVCCSGTTSPSMFLCTSRRPMIGEKAADLILSRCFA